MFFQFIRGSNALTRFPSQQENSNVEGMSSPFGLEVNKNMEVDLSVMSGATK